MAATKYILYIRYINEKVNVPVTNTTIEDYEKLKVNEIYTDDHKLYSPLSTLEEKHEAEKQKIEYMSNDLALDNPKIDMIFAYVGTQKVYHKQWVEDAEGYIMKDSGKSVPRDKVTANGDYTGDYVNIDGVVISKECPLIKEWANNQTENAKLVTYSWGHDVVPEQRNGAGELSKGTFVSAKTSKRFYTKQEVYDLCQSTTNAQLKSIDEIPLQNFTCYKYKTMTIKSSATLTEKKEFYEGLKLTIGKEQKQIKAYQRVLLNPYKANPATEVNRYDSVYNFDTMDEWENAMNVDNPNTDASINTGGIIIHESMLERQVIPGHMQETIINDSTQYPYAIKDIYQRIPLQPWFQFEVFSSLESALVRTRQLVDKIGVKNVKLIKHVPIDQYLKLV